MNENDQEPTKAKILASVVTKQGNSFSADLTVQRSHRFPVILMVQIENMAHMAGVSVSNIINELLEVGLDEVWKELPVEARMEIVKVRKEQYKMLGLSEDADDQTITSVRVSTKSAK